MAASTPTITGKDWQQITNAGQTGVIIVTATSKSRGANRVYITHSEGIPDGTSVLFPVLPVQNAKDATLIAPDNSNDIYYARCAGSNGIANPRVDVI